jgi:acyl-coenzyme A thioesterase PaaI-like protein
MTDRHDIITEFLFGGAPVQAAADAVRTEMLMDLRTEGWMGIPHGGIGMAAMAELGSYLNSGSLPYPFTADYRLGGSRLRVGDAVRIELSRGGSGITGKMTPQNADTPYLTAELFSSGAAMQDPAALKSYLPARLAEIEERLLALPYYRNCFVCGVERRDPGLKRKFSILDGPSVKPVVSLAGFDREDGGTFYLFQRNGVLHPLPILALLDEAIGWAGFMMTGSGAVTTRMGYAFFRPVRANERIIVLARGDKQRKTATRVMFWASGVAAAVAADGSFEVVAAASGQYLGMPELTEQMRTELMPRELTLRAFELAGGADD